MAICLCPEHGTSGCAPVCQHIASDFYEYRPFRGGRKIRFEDGDTDPLAYSMMLCHECLREFDIPDNVDTVLTEATLDRFPELDTPKMLCCHCFHRYYYDFC